MIQRFLHTKHSRLCIGLRQSLVAILCASLPAVHAQTYPSRTIRAIIPSGPSGFAGIVGRSVTDALTGLMGQPVVIDYRAGADGLIGMEACARALPDGYTICISHPAPVAIAPFVNAKLPYDAEKAFQPVINVGISSTVMVANQNAPFASLREAVELAKAKPGTVNWGTWGNSSLSNLYRVWIENNAGAKFAHIPYKIPDQAQQAVIAGEVAISFLNTQLAFAQLKAGRIKPLAMISLKRSRQLPDVPVFSELGFALEFRPWVGIFTPTGTPRPVFSRLNSDIGKLLADPAFVEKALTSISVDAVGGSPEQFADFLKSERKTLAELIRLAGVKPE